VIGRLATAKTAKFLPISAVTELQIRKNPHCAIAKSAWQAADFINHVKGMVKTQGGGNLLAQIRAGLAINSILAGKRSKTIRC
jgi:hypothetical protein